MRKYAIWIVLGVLVLICIMKYNGLVTSRGAVNSAWAEVQSQYQRRADLIPNLVAVVEKAADFERSTLEAVVAARARATSIQIDPNNLTPEKLAEFQQAQAQLSSSIGRLLAVAENYPQLQAVAGFRDLQAQLEGTENRIVFARDNYSKAATNYNVSIQKFPNNIFAGLFGFKERLPFVSDPGTDKAPKVKDMFDDKKSE